MFFRCERHSAYFLTQTFEFPRAGTYNVELTSHPFIFGALREARRDSAVGDRVMNASVVSTTQTLVLVVRPQDDSALFARERNIASEIDGREVGARTCGNGPPR